MTGKPKKKIVVAMSGGVDSSVAAALLLREGHEVIGAFMKNWSEDADRCTGECGWQRERADALRVASHLGIRFETFDFEQEYRVGVVDYMVREYAAGRTPNPDVMCNRLIKFGPFIGHARELGADFVATGHYARVGSPGLNAENRRSSTFRLLAGVDDNKDQSYFLHRLDQEQLSRTVFPVGGLIKSEVRRLAREFGLPTAEKKDSQGICFIGKVDLADFLKSRIPGRPGPVVTVEGEVVGKHDGLAPYTIGQRHGMDLGGGGEPYFVVEKDVARNTLVVARGQDHPALFTRELLAEDVHWISGQTPRFPLKCEARIRYRQPLQAVTVSAAGQTGLRAVFDQPQRAVSPGQFAVFYDGDQCLGGAVIARGSR